MDERETAMVIKTEVVGDDPERGEVQEARILNRVIRITQEGWEYEADQRHADLIIRESGAAPMGILSHPGGDRKVIEEEDQSEELKGAEATRFRGVAARANYLAVDRPDTEYAVKEVCRRMSAPRKGDWGKLQRLRRYLKGAPRCVLTYPWQGKCEAHTGYADSDRAGCRIYGKSTSDGIIMIGRHLIKSWSRTQDSVTLSSAEAELVALGKLAAEMLGIRTMGGDWGMVSPKVPSQLYTDASAALSIEKRDGAGKLRHINVRSLWLQQKAARQELSYEKIRGELNPADGLTKHVKQELMDRYAVTTGLRLSKDRAQSSLHMTSLR